MEKDDLFAGLLPVHQKGGDDIENHRPYFKPDYVDNSEGSQSRFKPTIGNYPESLPSPSRLRYGDSPSLCRSQVDTSTHRKKMDYYRRDTTGPIWPTVNCSTPDRRSQRR